MKPGSELGTEEGQGLSGWHTEKQIDEKWGRKKRGKEEGERE